MQNETLYADELTQLLIKQELRGFLVEKEWCLMDVLALDLGTLNLHAFEIKSSKDDAYRVFNQLPYYVWVIDYVWLVLGVAQKIPKRLPKWLGIIKFNGETFDRTYVPENKWSRNNEFDTIKQIYLANYGLPDDGKFENMAYASSWRFLTSFIKKWFINSVFGQKGKKIISYSKLEKGLLYYLKRVDSINDVIYEEKDGWFHPKHINISAERLAKVFRKMTLDEFQKGSE